MLLAAAEHAFAWAGLLQLLALGLVIAILMAALYAGWMLTHPPRRTYASAVARARPGDPSELPAPRPFSTWQFEHDGAAFPIWDIPGDDPRGPVILMTHGWADSRLGALQRLGPVLPVASRILAWDLRGHGEATGLCRLGTREVEDLVALIDHIRAGDPARPVVLFGWSLGAGVSIAAAARPEISPHITGVIAEAPYRLPWTPARRVMHARGLPYRANLPIAFFVLGLLLGAGPRWRNFDRARHAARLRCPLLVLHGEHDAICPVEDGRAIAEARHGTLAVIPHGGHNNLWTEPGPLADCSARLRTFLASLLAASAR